MNVLPVYLLLATLLSWLGEIECVELTFELEDNSRQCFYEDIKQGTKATLEYQVISGGKYDIDCTVEDADGLKLYGEKRKQYDAYEWDAQKDSTYQVCFSNEFSTITHKVVYFDLTVGGEKPLLDTMDHATALTQMESACVTIHESLKRIISLQTHFKLRESLGRTFAEHLGSRVQLWSIIQLIIMTFVIIGQVYVLRSFFANKHGVPRRTTT